MTSTKMNIQKINVQLLDEGTDVWRPAQADDLGNGLFKLLPTPDYDPTDEKWEFPPGSVVRGEMKDVWVSTKIAGKFTDVVKSVLVAVKP